jgi:hypothetical protein
MRMNHEITGSEFPHYAAVDTKCKFQVFTYCTQDHQCMHLTIVSTAKLLIVSFGPVISNSGLL